MVTFLITGPKYKMQLKGLGFVLDSCLRSDMVHHAGQSMGAAMGSSRSHCICCQEPVMGQDEGWTLQPQRPPLETHSSKHALLS